MSETTIAIVGMAGRFPAASNVNELWSHLVAGRNCVTFFSDEELRRAGVAEADLRSPDYVKAGAVLEDMESFDAGFFSIDPEEAEILDPQQRGMLECAHAAFEDAGYDPLTYRGLVGVYAGSAMSSYLLENLQPRYRDATPVERLQLSLANDKDHLPTRVSYKLNLKGPSVCVNTATSTSLVAIHLACRSLLDHECDMALAGGVSIRVPHVAGYRFQEGMIFSPDGHCRAFDKSASGTLFGNGIGVVVLKRLSDATRDGDNIHALIKGTAINNDGALKAGYTAPSVEAQAAVITKALSTAGVEPETISYIEAHGTGTRVGDPIEVAALMKAHRRRPSAGQYCALGSVKTNIGHLDAAAGVAGLIKVVLMLRNRTLVPSLNFKEPNPAIDFANSPFFVQTQTQPWTSPQHQPLRAGVSSFGMGGTNAHAILEEAPAQEREASAEGPELIVLSAKSDTQLNEVAARLARHLREHPELLLRDVAYTLAVGRQHHSHRRFVIGRDTQEVVRCLEGSVSDPYDSLSAMGDQWLRGEQIDWIAHYASRPVRIVSLPTYPFQRHRYWVERAADKRSAPVPVRVRDITPHLQSRIAEVLGLQPPELPDVNQRFMELHLESLTLIGIANKLGAEWGLAIPASWLIEYPTLASFARHVNEMLAAAPPAERPADAKASIPVTQDSRIAIIAMAGRFPGASDIDQYWRNLCEGTESISRFSPQDLQASGAWSAQAADPNFVMAQGVLQDVEYFDHHFFEYSPHEARLIDPQQRLFLEQASVALEIAGYNPDTYPGKIGVYAGVSTNTYLYNYVVPENASPDAARQFHIMVANDKDYLSTRVSYKLNLTGPSYTIQTACSTSLVAIHVACKSLLAGECEIALAGGVTVRVPQVSGYLYEEGMILSKDGRVRSFDAGANGTVWGNGVGIVVLKPLDKALRDGDTVHAIIRGSATNNDGAFKASYAAPSKDGQARAVLDALSAASVDAQSITYVEAHGTGTLLGDPVEVAALTQAFRAQTAATGFCAIGSVKSNIGHLDSAAGVAGLIKTVLMLKHQKLVPTINFERPNPDIDFLHSPFYVSRHLAPWNSSSGPRLAGVTSLGVGGTNAHVILEEAPAQSCGASSSRPQILVQSAKTPEALEQMGGMLDEYLQKHPEVNPADVAYTLAVGRRAYKHRRARVLGSAGSDFAGEVSGREPSIAFVFSRLSTTQSWLPKARVLLEIQPIFWEHVQACYRLLDGAHAPEPFAERSDLCWTFTLCYSLASYYMALGIRPQVVAGAGLGELVSAVITGALSLRQALRLLSNERSDTAEVTSSLATLQGHHDAILCIGSREDWPQLQVMEGADVAACLARLWTQGFAIDWARYYDGETRRRIALPTYPLTRHRHWIDRAPSHFGTRLTQRQPANESSADDRCMGYVPVWNTQPAIRNLEPIAADLALLVIGASEQQRALVRPLFPSARFLSLDPDEPVESIAKKLGQQSIAHLLWVAPEPQAQSVDDDALIRDQRAGVVQVFRTIKALLSLGYASKELELTLLTRNAQHVLDEDRVEPSHAAVHGLAGSLARELEHWSIRLLDMDSATDWPLAQMLRQPAQNGETRAWRNGEWFTQQLISGESLPPGPADYRMGGVYVLIGGAGGVGEVLSRYLAEKYLAHTVWIGRRPVDQAMLAKIHSFPKWAPAPLYISADAADRESLASAYSQIRQRFSRIDGVIHCAISLIDRSLANMEEQELLACLSAKVDVSVRMAQVFGADPPDLVVFLSSIQSFCRSGGTANYAAACMFKDAFARRLSLAWPGAVKTVNWGYWGSRGVLDRAEYREWMARSGIGSIQPEHGMAALAALIRSSAPQLVFDRGAGPELWQQVSAEERYRFYPAEAPSVITALRRRR